MCARVVTCVWMRVRVCVRACMDRLAPARTLASRLTRPMPKSRRQLSVKRRCSCHTRPSVKTMPAETRAQRRVRHVLGEELGWSGFGVTPPLELDTSLKRGRTREVVSAVPRCDHRLFCLIQTVTTHTHTLIHTHTHL